MHLTFRDYRRDILMLLNLNEIKHEEQSLRWKVCLVVNMLNVQVTGS